MSSLRLLYSNSHDPWFNLAVEETIFKHMSTSQKVLFLWRNDNTVVIGRAQNPWKECNTRKMDQDGIKLARRSSGGGAVFHDLGNTNFTFMAGKPEYDKSISTQIILNALTSLNISAEASGRNDLIIQTIDGVKKISGSAYKETADRGFHHGTLLLNANLNRLTDYLNPDPKKLKAKGITSVRARVANLIEVIPDITHDQVCQAISNAFFDYFHDSAEVEIISPDNPPALPGFSEKFAEQSSWDWNFGRAPAFTHFLEQRFTWGGIEIHFDIEEGHLSQVKIFTDSLTPAPLEELAIKLKGSIYHSDVLQQQCYELIPKYPQQQIELTQLGTWLEEVTR